MVPPRAHARGVENSPDQRLTRATKQMNIEACDQCGKCPSSCPATAHIEGFNPRQIIAKVALGREADLMKSQVIWTCTSCLKCKERCPEEISPYDAILALRRIAIDLELPHPQGFDEVMKTVVETGCTQQSQLMRTRSKERIDRRSMGLPPMESPKNLAMYTEILKEILSEEEA
jgi:heterodisulfide reductase subunit C